MAAYWSDPGSYYSTDDFQVTVNWLDNQDDTIVIDDFVYGPVAPLYFDPDF